MEANPDGQEQQGERCACLSIPVNNNNNNKRQLPSTWRTRVEFAVIEVIRKGFSCRGGGESSASASSSPTMDDQVRQELVEELAELSAEVVQRATSSSASSVKEMSQCKGQAKGSPHGETCLEDDDSDKSLPLAHLQTLLQRQTEVARAVTDQEQSAWKMLSMINNLTKIIADQEHMILSLQKERAGAERMAAEISVDLRTQYVEISNLKKRYDSAEEQLSSVQDTVRDLQAEIYEKDKLLASKEATIMELRERLAQRQANGEQKQLEGGIDQKRQDRDKRLAEIRTILSRSSSTSNRPTTNPRLQALRAARDSRLNEIRGLLQKNNNTARQVDPPTATLPSQQACKDLVHDRSTSSTSDESVSDISSLGSSVSDSEERHRLYEALVRQRQNLRTMP